MDKGDRLTRPLNVTIQYQKVSLSGGAARISQAPSAITPAKKSSLTNPTLAGGSGLQPRQNQRVTPNAEVFSRRKNARFSDLNLQAEQQSPMGRQSGNFSRLS